MNDTLYIAASAQTERRWLQLYAEYRKARKKGLSDEERLDWLAKINARFEAFLRAELKESA